MTDALDLIFRGCSHPYDDASDSPPIYDGADPCRVAALAILAGLTDRGGLDCALGAIDYATRREIVTEMTETVRTAMEPVLGSV